MTRTTLALCTTVFALSALGYACGAVDLELSSGAEAGTADGAARETDGGAAAPEAVGDSTALGPVDNAVILVHAAKSPAFRLCFEKETKRLPQPDSQTMPEANVVGVEVGSAVRLGPLRGTPGRVFLFDEPLIRAYYTNLTGADDGPTCKDLLEGATASLGREIGVVDADLSRGVHLLVVRGCPANGPVQTFSAAECGEGWTPTTHNLTVKEIELTGTNRTSSTTLPAQVVNLSQALESARGNRELVVTFGNLAGGGAHTPVVTNPELFGNAVPVDPARLPVADDDISIFESTGFRVSLVTTPTDGGAASTEAVVDQSLAKVQKASSPRDVPPTYYAAASNYALLLLGDPAVTTDERRKVHFLAVPVVAPKADAGTEPPAGNDGGSAP